MESKSQAYRSILTAAILTVTACESVYDPNVSSNEDAWYVPSEEQLIQLGTYSDGSFVLSRDDTNGSDLNTLLEFSRTYNSIRGMSTALVGGSRSFRLNPPDPTRPARYIPDSASKIDAKMKKLVDYADLTPQQTVVQNQDLLGTCSAFAATAFLEWALKRFRGLNLDLSEQTAWSIAMKKELADILQGIRPFQQVCSNRWSSLLGRYLRECRFVLAASNNAKVKLLPNDKAYQHVIDKILTEGSSSASYNYALETSGLPDEFAWWYFPSNHLFYDRNRLTVNPVRLAACFNDLAAVELCLAGEPAPATLNSARRYSLAQLGLRVKTIRGGIAEFHRELLRGFPVRIIFDFYQTFYLAGSNGVLPEPVAGDAVIGTHAVLLVGYDPLRRAYKFKNSWGTTWGDSGYGYIPRALAASIIHPIGYSAQ